VASPGREGATSHLFPPASDAGATTRRGELGYSTGRPSIWRWPGPFGRQVGEPGNSHAMRKPSIDGRFDEVGREEGQRDCHVDLPRSAALPVLFD
jgi:hypothetical protein